jgi:hypothetical protein
MIYRPAEQARGSGSGGSAGGMAREGHEHASVCRKCRRLRTRVDEVINCGRGRGHVGRMHDP